MDQGIGAGRRKFLDWFRSVGGSNLSRVAADYQGIPEGYRNLLAVQAGLPQLKSVRLDAMSSADREKLMAANTRLERLVEQTRSVLVVARLADVSNENGNRAVADA